MMWGVSREDLIRPERREVNPQEYDPPSPEEDPEGYAMYLRRRVVAMARRYFVEHGHEELEAKGSYAGLPIVVDRVLVGDRASLEHVIQAIKDLDDWKREFSLKDID